MQLGEIARKMRRTKSSLGVVVRNHVPAPASGDVTGVVTKARIADVLAESIESLES